MQVSGLQLATLPVPLPAAGTVLGGSLELHGNTISLACFHGLNFKSKSWALFSLKEPLINFTTEVQETLGDSELRLDVCTKSCLIDRVVSLVLRFKHTILYI